MGTGLEPEPSKPGECTWIANGSVLDNFSFIRFSEFRKHIDFNIEDFSQNPSLIKMLKIGEEGGVRNVMNIKKDISDLRMELHRLYMRRKEQFALQVS